MTSLILKPNNMRRLMSTCSNSKSGPLQTLTKCAVSTSTGPWMGAAQAAGNGSIEQSKFLASLEKYSTYQPTPVSIQHFIKFAKNACPQSSFLFLKRELPVRLANIMKELQLLPHQLHDTHACKIVVDDYAQSFRDVLAFEKSNPKDPEVLKGFAEALHKVRERHTNTVIIMAEAVMEMKANAQRHGQINGTKQPRYMENIQYFLDRLYISRISTRMLINQHTALFTELDQKSTVTAMDGSSSMIGSIDVKCEISPIISSAYGAARDICEYHYMTAPELDYRAVNGVPGDDSPAEKISFVYIPSHLYHIMFELIKNSMRATIEKHGDHTVNLPPIKIRAIKGTEDVTIRVSDQGGGIPRRMTDTLFEYLYTTAPTPAITSSVDMPPGMGGMGSHAPLAGYGYGLPLSRLYARYFNGDLTMSSIEGFGTEVFIYLQALESEAKERLPVYHETGSKKIYEAKLTASDWTGSKNDNR